jgi:uncharacterized protein
MTSNRQSTVSDGWRAHVQRLVRERAEIEARRKWQLAANEAIPFNYRWEHVQAVVGLALRLAQETGADPLSVEAAAWLHDICKTQANHGEAGAREAEAILSGTDFPQAKIPIVVDAIRQHVGLFREEDAPPLQPVEAAVLWDADKLSKLGVQALFYNVSAPYVFGKSQFERMVDLTEFCQNVLSRTVTSMNTQPGAALARERFAAMLNTLEIWENEEMAQVPELPFRDD